MPTNGFRSIEMVNQLVFLKPIQVNRGQQAEQLKANLNEFEKLTARLSFEIENHQHIVNEHFIELKRKVNLTAKEQITDLVSKEQILECQNQQDELIKRVNTYQKECCQSFASNKAKQVGENK